MISAGETATALTLVEPDLENLQGFEAALAAGWSPDPRRAGDRDYIESLHMTLGQNRAAFLVDLTKPGDTLPRPDGTGGHRLRSLQFWIWDGEFCGNVNLRFQPGTIELPPRVSGHIGYSVVPWKQGKGYATMALKRVLDVARDQSLGQVVILCDEHNHASRRVIERNGGILFETAPHASDRPDRLKLHFRISLDADPR
ncbi:GNAT family N-acetyltransferase [Rhizobium herbae]|uniref:Acetyltransferase n=1 Tax=Rhizobium herbae TaxID=508661 RepID=A0ABS4EGP9_9HYPH|nr:GNAT family N-acetyltransferase [Rhizobium herbae]MBP1857118.1 putative acetyltransferase [Rhizobium herbae]